jgi:hypothetical protein
MSQNRYSILKGGQYLEARFGYAFPDELPERLVPLGDQIFSMAQDLERLRTRLDQSMRELEQNFGWMRQSLRDGTQSVWRPVGMNTGSIHPYVLASQIEDQERILVGLLDVLKGLLAKS